MSSVYKRGTPPVEAVDTRPRSPIAVELEHARCDRGDCPSKAYVATIHDTGHLFWCRHHYEALPWSAQALVGETVPVPREVSKNE